jgi:hypothetical protein
VNSRTLPIKPAENEFEKGLQFYGVTTNSDNYKGLPGIGNIQPVTHPTTYKPPTGAYYYILTCLYAYMLTYQHIYTLTYLHTYILTYLHTYILTRLRA